MENSVATLSDGTAPTCPPKSRHVYESLPWMAALSIGTGGLYLAYWIHRVAKLEGAGERYRWRPWLWAVGSIMSPIGCAVLYLFTGWVHRDADKFGVHLVMPRGGPAILYGAVSGALFFGPWSVLWLPTILLTPIPFIWVQHGLNQIHLASNAERTPRSTAATGLRWATALLAAPLVLTVAGGNDAPLATALFDSRGSGVSLALEGAPVSVVLPSGSWRRVDGYLGDGEAALELLGPGASTWMVAFTMPASEASIGSTVAARRAVIDDEQSIREFSERRFFLEGADLVPASVCRYETGSQFIESGLFVVTTLQLESTVVELIGFTGSPMEHEAEVLSLLTDVRVAAEVASE